MLHCMESLPNKNFIHDTLEEQTMHLYLIMVRYWTYDSI